MERRRSLRALAGNHMDLCGNDQGIVSGHIDLSIRPIADGARKAIG
jgi:hypothetical protein